MDRLQVRTKRIIAVFGGSTSTDVLASAQKLGHVIAEEGQILLTGGTGPATDFVSVKKSDTGKGGSES